MSSSLSSLLSTREKYELIHAEYLLFALVVILALVTGYSFLGMMALIWAGSMLISERFSAYSLFGALPFLAIYIAPLGIGIMLAGAVLVIFFVRYFRSETRPAEHRSFLWNVGGLVFIALGLLPLLPLLWVITLWYGYTVLSILRARRTM